MMNFLKKGYIRIKEFLNEDIWESTPSSPLKRSVYKLLKVASVSISSFSKDKVFLRASALTFYSLLSIIPFLAMVFGISKGFGFENTLRTLILNRFKGQEEVATRLIEISTRMLENVKGGVVAGIGLIILIYTSLKILSHMENAMNDIWYVKNSRDLWKKINDYVAIMFIGTLVWILSSALTVSIATEVKSLLSKISILNAISPAIYVGFRFIPYCVIWILFTFLYSVMPNTRVTLASSLIGGIIGGSIYQIFQWGYIKLQIHVLKYNTVYGSFAALPMFFIWLNISWLIFLFGAEISYAYQNHESYRSEEMFRNLSHTKKRLLELGILHLIIQKFKRGEPPPTPSDISEQLHIPASLVDAMLDELQGAGLINRLEGDRKVFQIAKDPDEITIKSAMEFLDKEGMDMKFKDIDNEPIKRLKRYLDELEAHIESSPYNLKLKDI